MVELGEMMDTADRNVADLHISISLPVGMGMKASRRAADDHTSLKGTAQNMADTIRAYGEAGIDEVVLSLSSHEKSAHAEMIEMLTGEVRQLVD